MAALINPVVSALFRFKNNASTSSIGHHPTAPSGVETSGNRWSQETPLQTLSTTSASFIPTWRQRIFHWLVGPVFAASQDGVPSVPEKVQKRQGYIEWEEYYMAIAFLSAKRSKDPNKQVGACIVNRDKKIVGMGYNGMPTGSSDDDMPWGTEPMHTLENKNLYVCHAELNAIVNKNEADLKGCTIYTGLFPCNECAKLIVQSGIKEVVYFSDEKKAQDKYRGSKRLFDRAQVKHRKYLSEKYTSKILVDFNDPTKSA